MRPGLLIRTELKALDIQIVEHPAIAEAVAIRISDHLRALCEQNFLVGPTSAMRAWKASMSLIGGSHNPPISPGTC